MELTGSRQIAADRPAVWAALNDPAVLKAAIPGCQEMTGDAASGFHATVKQKVGPVSATFNGQVTLSNVVEGESYTISGEGKGGAAGFAKGGADVRLEDSDGGTLLSYDVKANVGGKIAQLGTRLIDGFVKKMADQFFENFQKAVEGADAEKDPLPAADASAAADAAAQAPAASAPAMADAAPAPAAAAAAPAPAAATVTEASAGAAPKAAEAAGKKQGWFARLIGRKG